MNAKKAQNISKSLHEAAFIVAYFISLLQFDELLKKLNRNANSFQPLIRFAALSKKSRRTVRVSERTSDKKCVFNWNSFVSCSQLHHLADVRGVVGLFHILISRFAYFFFSRFVRKLAFKWHEIAHCFPLPLIIRNAVECFNDAKQQQQQQWKAERKAASCY